MEHSTFECACWPDSECKLLAEDMVERARYKKKAQMDAVVGCGARTSGWASGKPIFCCKIRRKYHERLSMGKYPCLARKHGSLYSTF